MKLGKNKILEQEITDMREILFLAGDMLLGEEIKDMWVGSCNN
jgi:hypothetical protein